MLYASFWRRFLATMIDSIILWIPSLVLGTNIGSIPSSIGISLILGILYFGIFESSAMGATPGKALLNMVVVSEAGDRISFKAACIRYFCRYLSSIMLGIGYLMQPFTSKRQTLHDMISETLVIDRQIPDINYFTVWKDQFKVVVGKF